MELSDDLKHAKAYISVMPEEQAKLTMHGLISATSKLRKDVMHRIHIKEMPTLKLVYDEGRKAEMEVFALLEQDRREQEERKKSRGETVPSDQQAPQAEDKSAAPSPEDETR